MIRAAERAREPRIEAMSKTPIVFPVTWLTSRPLLRGNRLAIALGMVPVALALLALASSIRATDANQGPLLLSVALFMSLGASVIQLPSFSGRIVMGEETLTVVTQLAGRRGQRVIQRDQIRRAFYAPLERPPGWLPFAWAVVEALLVLGAAAAGWRGGGEHWTWLTGFAVGLSFWPLMAARWRAAMQVVLIYGRPEAEEPGLILAWVTPHEASSLIHTMQGKIDWEPPPEPS